LWAENSVWINDKSLSNGWSIVKIESKDKVIPVVKHHTTNACMGVKGKKVKR
jgi:hypothetical protein